MRVHAGLAKQALVACGLLCGGGVKGGNVISTTRGAVQIKRHKKPKPNADENAGHVGLPCCVSVSCTVTATAVSCICVSLLPPCPYMSLLFTLLPHLHIYLFALANFEGC